MEVSNRKLLKKLTFEKMKRFLNKRCLNLAVKTKDMTEDIEENEKVGNSEKTEGVEVKEEKEVKGKAYRDIVIPGESLAEKSGKRLGNGVYEENDKVFAKTVGIPITNENEIKVIPMAGVYIPRINDKVIGIMTKVEISGWMVDINSPYMAFLAVSEGVDEFVDVNRMDISRFFDVGDVIFCKVSKVTKNKIIRVSMRSLGTRKLYGGVVVKVKPVKIPRIIGKAGSMINLIKQKTGCVIYVGKNGIIWIRGDNKAKAIEAILTIERESHTVGLTDKIDKMLGGLETQNQDVQGAGVGTNL